MSESSTCGCGKSSSACSSPAKSETKSTSSTSETSSTKSSSSSSSSASSSSSGIQNGKGDAPRNISPRFRKNFDSIRWDSPKKAKRQEGVKFVKTY